MSNSIAREARAPWPAALGACFCLLIGRGLACDRDPYQYGNAWAEDHSGYCTATGWHGLTSGPGGFVLGLALLAVTVGLPLLTILAGAAVAGRRNDPRLTRIAWLATGLASLAVVAFFVLAGHATIVGGGGG